MAAIATPITFPRTFGADLAYKIGAILFSFVGFLTVGVTVTHHQTQALPEILLPFALFFGVLLLVMTFQLEVDETGLRQKYILGRKTATWDQVRRLDQGRAYSIYGADDRELVWLSLVSTAAQLAIAEEAIRRADLRPSGAKLEYPVRNQWVR